MRAIVLAAGKGKRLQSEHHSMPKVLRLANGKPLLRYVTQNISFVGQENTVLVVGYKQELVREQFSGFRFAEQTEQLGTGHAVASAREQFRDYDGPVLVCYGDMPMLTEETFRKAVDVHITEKNDCTVLTGISDRPLAYGRIIRGTNGEFQGVVEERDCTPEQKAINELNIGVYVFDSTRLFGALENLRNDNAQGEYYLTDAPALIMAAGGKIGTYIIRDEEQLIGVNTPEDLALCEQILQRRNGE